VKQLLWRIALLLGLTLPVAAQRPVNRYVLDSLMGPGTYVLANGTRGAGELQFKTRSESVLYINRKQPVPAAQLQSFSVAGHTFWPHGNFLFEYGLHTYQAQHAFIEYADTTGGVHLAVYYTVEPTGDWNTTFTTFLLRPRGSQQFIMGPTNAKKWLQPERECLAPYFAQWPNVQQAILNGWVMFENLPAYVRLTRQPLRHSSKPARSSIAAPAG
jgi:hypothetical protein